jgi:methionyl-tRNA synthetase
MPPKLLVTSALFYANGPIHLGHLVEVVQTDVFVRAQRLLGRDVIYVCADDTHGTPIELSAQKQGITPEELIARSYKEHVRDFADFEISFDEYGSTHTEENRAYAELIYERLRAGGHIEKRTLELTYCENDKRFLPDRFVRGTCPRCGSADQYGDVCEVCKSTYSPTELLEPRCALCGTPPVRRESENYFFKLNDFGDLLRKIAYGESPPRMDPQIERFLQGWIAQGLQDWNISRDGPYFGFAIPGAPGKYFYVWLDAPIGYISNTDRLLRRRGTGSISDYWGPEADSEIWHFIGKDIIYFHALFWPAMLAASDFKLPSRLVVHGMLSVKGEKMSKSRGRPMNARSYLETGLNPEQLRYYYAASLTPQPNDIDLNVEEFRNRVNAELVNNLANFCHRTFSLLRGRFEGQIIQPSSDPAATLTWRSMADRFEKVIEGYRSLDTREAVAQLVEIGNAGNLFLQQRKPWDLGSTAHGDLSLCANGAFAVALLLSPVVPRMAEAVLDQLGRRDATFADLSGGPWISSGTLAPGPQSLMARVEVAQANALLPEAIAPTSPVAAAAIAPPPDKQEPKGLVGIEQFAALDLRCGLILAADPVAGATKLLKLRVDLGEETPRTIASAIAESFAPESLVGRRVVVVANLEPRKIRGIESRGMLLATGEGTSIRLVSLPEDVVPGSPVK